jgi:hypothetical protein
MISDPDPVCIVVNGNAWTAYHPADISATASTAPEMTTRLPDMTASFEISTIRCTRCFRRANAVAAKSGRASANASSASA